MKIKIFGERNTATNALRTLIAQNSSSFIHPGTMAELPEAERQKAPKPPYLKPGDREAAIDTVFASQPIEQRWKHAATYFPRMEPAKDTHFVFTVRHPLSWLQSFHKNPHNRLIEVPSSLARFAVCDWRTVGRDQLPNTIYEPLAMYGAKIRSYQRFQSILQRNDISYTLIKFEDIIQDQEGCIERLRPYLDAPADEVKLVEKATKGGGKSLKGYQDYYGKELWRNEFPAALAKTLKFDPRLLRFMGYEASAL